MLMYCWGLFVLLFGFFFDIFILGNIVFYS